VPERRLQPLPRHIVQRLKRYVRHSCPVTSANRLPQDILARRGFPGALLDAALECDVLGGRTAWTGRHPRVAGARTSPPVPPPKPDSERHIRRWNGHGH
jgi:hypothetical protein